MIGYKMCLGKMWKNGVFLENEYENVLGNCCESFLKWIFRENQKIFSLKCLWENTEIFSRIVFEQKNSFGEK